jgi:hypothetical protein
LLIIPHLKKSFFRKDPYPSAVKNSPPRGATKEFSRKKEDCAGARSQHIVQALLLYKTASRFGDLSVAGARKDPFSPRRLEEHEERIRLFRG